MFTYHDVVAGVSYMIERRIRVWVWVWIWDDGWLYDLCILRSEMQTCRDWWYNTKDFSWLSIFYASTQHAFPPAGIPQSYRRSDRSLSERDA